MPYIVSTKRAVLDKTISTLHHQLVELELDHATNNFEGNLNYTITKLLSLCYSSPSYRELNDVVGVLECIKLEYYRKVGAPYEDNKEFENGPVHNKPQ